MGAIGKGVLEGFDQQMPPPRRIHFLITGQTTQAFEKAKYLLSGDTSAGWRRHGQNTPGTEFTHQGWTLTHRVRSQVGAGHRAVAAVHGRHDGVGDGTSVERLRPITGDEFQGLGLMFVHDEVVHLDTTFIRQTRPRIGKAFTQLRMIAPNLTHCLGNSDVGDVSSKAFAGGSDGRRQHGSAVQGAEVFEGVDQAGHSAGNAA